jgi:hypothetical protein
MLNNPLPINHLRTSCIRHSYLLHTKRHTPCSPVPLISTSCLPDYLIDYLSPFFLLRSRHLYYSRARTTNSPCLKKRTQFQKRQNEHKPCFNNELRQMDTWSRRKKRTQTNPISSFSILPILPTFTPANFKLMNNHLIINESNSNPQKTNFKSVMSLTFCLQRKSLNLPRPQEILEINNNQTKHDSFVDTTDCLEAVRVFRGWKNFLFVIILLGLSLLQAGDITTSSRQNSHTMSQTVIRPSPTII